MWKRRIILFWDRRIMGKNWDTLVTLYHGFCISLGGFIFGYYSGTIIGLLYIQDDFQSLMQEAIMNTGFLGGVSGVVFASWANDSLGRKRSLLIADVLIIFGGILIMWQQFLLGKIILSLGVGLISGTSPLYISEISIPRLRDALICTNCSLFFGFGNLLSFYLGYHANLQEPARTNIMIVACIPALLQFILVILSLPESPAWLCVTGRNGVDIVEALKTIYSVDDDVVKEINALKLCLEDENKTLNGNRRSPFMKAWSSHVVRKQVAYGVSLQVVKQSVGINALMYCIPFVIKMWGVNGRLVIPIHDHITCQKYTLLNLYGHLYVVAAIISVCFIRARSRKHVFSNALVTMLWFVSVLSFIFMVAPAIDTSTSGTITHFWSNNRSSSYNWKPLEDSGAQASSWDHCLPKEQDVPPGAVAWDCLGCLKNFTGGLPWFRPNKRDIKLPEDRDRSSVCPGSLYWVIAVEMVSVYILYVSAGLEMFPWTVNSEIYPTRIRGFCGAMGTMANWISFLIVSLVFFNLVRFLGPLCTLLVLCFINYFGWKFIQSFV